MKSYFLSAVFISLFFLSCDSEDTIQQDASMLVQVKSASTYKKGPAANSANIYDIAGQVHLDLFTSYNGSIATHQVIINNVEQLAAAHTDFSSIANGYTSVTASQLLWVATNAPAPQNIMAACSSDNVRDKLAGLLAVIESNHASSYSTLHSEIVNYENNIISSTLLTSQEKQTILTTSSIARHICYATSATTDNGKWKKVRFALYGSIAGAETDMATAITLSVSAGIAAGAE